jgi:hypothetical protein
MYRVRHEGCYNIQLDLSLRFQVNRLTDIYTSSRRVLWSGKQNHICRQVTVHINQIAR